MKKAKLPRLAPRPGRKAAAAPSAVPSVAAPVAPAPATDTPAEPPGPTVGSTRPTPKR